MITYIIQISRYCQQVEDSQARDEWGNLSQGGEKKELALSEVTKCSQTLGCTWVPQCRKSLLMVIPFPLLFALVGWCLHKVRDSSPNGDVKEWLIVIAGGTHKTEDLLRTRDGWETGLCNMWLYPDRWACFLQIWSANKSKTSCHMERSQDLGFYLVVKQALPLLA